MANSLRSKTCNTLGAGTFDVICTLQRKQS